MALEDVLAAAVVRPVVVGWLDFADDPQRGWDGPGTLLPSGTGDDDLDGETFNNAAGVIDIEDIKQDLGIGGPVTLTFAAGETDDEPIVQQLIADRRAYLGRRAKFWRMFLNAGESAVLPEFDVLFNGVMVGAGAERQTGKAATISVTCDQDTQKAHSAPVRWTDHQVFYPSDTASTFANDLSRGSVAGADATAGPTPRRLPSNPNADPAPRPRTHPGMSDPSTPPPSTPRRHPAQR